MVINLAIFVAAALFTALISVGSGSATYTTVVMTTTTVLEEENPSGQSCQREIQQMTMKHCMKWMQSEVGGGRTPYAAASTFLRSAVGNSGRYQEEEELEECCNEFRRVSSTCRCEAMEHMMKQMQQQYGTEEAQQTIKERMESLPRVCHMRSPTQYCRFPTV